MTHVYSERCKFFTDGLLTIRTSLVYVARFAQIRSLYSLQVRDSHLLRSFKFYPLPDNLSHLSRRDFIISSTYSRLEEEIFLAYENFYLDHFLSLCKETSIIEKFIPPISLNFLYDKLLI